MKSALIVLVVLAAAATFAMLAAPIDSIFLLELGYLLILAALPTLLLYLAPTLLIWQLLPRVRLIGALMIAVVAVNLMGAGYNVIHAGAVARLKGETLNAPVKIEKGPFLFAIQDSLASTVDGCDRLCGRMLLARSAASYATVQVNNYDSLINLIEGKTAKKQLTSLAITSGAACPGESFGDILMETGVLYLPAHGPTDPAVTEGDAEFELKRLQGSGQCLANKVAPVTDLQTVVYVGRVWASPYWSEWLSSPFKMETRTIEVLAKRDHKWKTVFRDVRVFSYGVSFPVAIRPGSLLLNRLNILTESNKMFGLWRLSTAADRLAFQQSSLPDFRRNNVSDPDFPYVFSVIQKKLGLTLDLPYRDTQMAEFAKEEQGRASRLLSTEVQRHTLIAAAKAGKQPSGDDIENFIGGLLAPGTSTHAPPEEIAALLRAAPRSEVDILKALLRGMTRMKVPPNFIPSNATIVEFSKAIGVFSDTALAQATTELSAVDLDIMQVGSMPNLTAALATRGDSQVALIKSMLENYEANFPKPLRGPGMTMYRSAMSGLCVLGRRAAGLNDIVKAMGDRDALILQANSHDGGRTLMTFSRMGAMDDEVWRIFEQSGWSRAAFDAFNSTEFTQRDCFNFGLDGDVPSILAAYPTLRKHWPKPPRKKNTQF